MSQYKQQKNIIISVRDLELGSIEEQPNLNDISCYLTIFTEEKETKTKSNKCFDMLILSDPLNSAKFKIIDNAFQSQKLIGSVSIDLSIFAESNNIQIDQWVNLITCDNEDQSPNQLSEPKHKKNAENTVRLKMRFQVKDIDDTMKTQDELDSKNEQLNNEKNIFLNTTIQPCVNFPTKEEKNKEELNYQQEQENFDTQRERQEQRQQNLANIESRLVLTPERLQTLENSSLFQNKFQELISKLMETRNQSLVNKLYKYNMNMNILDVNRQLNENHKRELEKNTLTDILKRLNESQIYIEDDLLQDLEQEFNNINISLSSIHQGNKKQASPEPTKRNRFDLEGEIASLRLELEKKQEYEQITKDLKIQLFRQERDNQSLLNQYNKAVDNYQKYFTELNDENHKLKQKISLIEKEKQQKDNLYQQLKVQFDEQLKTEKLKYQSALIQESIINIDGILDNYNDKDEQNTERLQTILMKHKQQISQYSQMLVESQNESVEFQAKMYQMQQEIEELQQKLKDQTSSQNTMISNVPNNQNQVDEINKNQTSSSLLKQINEDDQAFLQKLIKDKTFRIAELEDEKTKIEYINQKSNNTIKQLNEKIKNLQKQLENTSSCKQNDLKQILEENIKLKTQIHESEQLKSELEDHFKAKYDQLKLEDKEKMKEQNTLEINKDQQEQLKILVEELEQKITFISELSYINKDQKVQIQALQEKVKILELNQNEVEQLKKNYRDLQQEKEKINSDLYSVTEDLLRNTTENLSQKSLIAQLSNEVKRLVKIIENLEKNSSNQYNYSTKKREDEVDLKLQEFLSRNVTPIKFVRIEEGLYTFGTKRIIVKLLKGKLNCRVGSGFLAIEEFLQLYTLQELIKMKQTSDFSQLNYPISEQKIDELILQDIQYNQQQFKHIQESQNNNANNKLQSTLPQKSQNDTNQNYIKNSLLAQQNFNHSDIYNNNNFSKNISLLKNSEIINQATPSTQQDQYTQNTENPQSNMNNNSLMNLNNTLNVSPCANKSCEMESNQSFDNLNNYLVSNTKTVYTQPNIDQRLTSLKTDHSCERKNTSQSIIKPFVISQPSPSIQQPSIYNNNIVHDINNQQIIMNSGNKNQEINRHIRGQTQNDILQRNDQEYVQQINQLAGNIKNNEIMRRYSLSQSTAFNGQQQVVGYQNCYQNSFNVNNHKSFSQQQQQYPIDIQNMNMNHQILNSRNSIQNSQMHINKVNNVQPQQHPPSYSIRATPLKQSTIIDNSSAATCIINTPQKTNSSSATPKRNELSKSTYQERILNQQSHKRSLVDELSPYSHNKYSSNIQTFQAQNKAFYIHK